MTGNTVTVLKANTPSNIPEEELRKGDVALVQAGDLVPADLQLVEAIGLVVDEWELTGEIAPATKQIGEKDVFIYRGSRITHGQGKGIVIAAGEVTEYAKILQQCWELRARRPPALITRRSLLLLLLLLPAGVLLLSHYHNAFFVCALIGLAASLIVWLQDGAWFTDRLTVRAVKDLAQQNIDVRDVSALEVISNVDIATRQDGANRVDKALLGFAAQNGYVLVDIAPQYRRISDKPFDSEARYMAVGFERDDRR